ncbi:MAG TPA: hypothetical protein VIV10_10675 [Gemmatimonadales bacterium]
MSVDRSTAAPRHPQTDPAITVKRFDAPESVLVLDQGRLELVTIGGRLVGKGSYAPGWRLSNTLVPPRRVGAGPGEQTGVVLSGRAKIRGPGGVDIDLTPGDFFHVAADYECWVVGYRPCEILYFDGMEALLDRMRGDGGKILRP